MNQRTASRLAGALAGGPKGGLQRVSPGVYRNQQGGLVGSKGQQLPGNRQQPQRPNINLTTPAPRPPMNGGAPGSQFSQEDFARMRDQFQQTQQGGMMYAGGSPNFNESTGQYHTNGMPQGGYQQYKKPFPMGNMPMRQPFMGGYQPQMPGMMQQPMYQQSYMPQQYEQMDQQFQQPQQQPQQPVPFNPGQNNI